MQANTIIADIPRIGLNAEDAAAALGITKRMLQDLVRAGEIACAYPGPQTQIFDPEELREWLKASKTKKNGTETTNVAQAVEAR